MISVSTSALRGAKWWEYALRFVLGGLVTAAAGFLAKNIGPGFGGLFLAFPAILAASSTLVEKHERERKEKKGLRGISRGRHAAGADAAGATMGSMGLIAFAVFVWRLLPAHNPWAVIISATVVWMLVCGIVWLMWKQNLFRRMRVATSHREELAARRRG